MPRHRGHRKHRKGFALSPDLRHYLKDPRVSPSRAITMLLVDHYQLDPRTYEPLDDAPAVDPVPWDACKFGLPLVTIQAYIPEPLFERLERQPYEPRDVISTALGKYLGLCPRTPGPITDPAEADQDLIDTIFPPASAFL